MSIRKIDSNYRVSIGKDNLRELGWDSDDIVRVYTEGNKVIIDKSENVTEVKSEPKRNKSRISEIVDKIPQQFSAIEESTIIKINKKPIEERCHKCLSKLNGSKFKLNGRFICRNCKDELKNSLILDIQNRRENFNG